MTMKIVLRLCLMMAIMLSFYSCMNEELYSSSEKEKQEIQSKSLWKEDMVFIANVKEIFLKNANLKNFRNNHGGLPQWDYAMTFGNFNESYLMVPVFGEKEVTGVVTVKRIEDMVYFKFSEDKKAKSFFTHLIFSENKKLTPVKEIPENAKIICSTRTYQLCFTNNDGSEDCHPQTVVQCISEESLDDNDMGGDNSGDNGLPYGGGSGNNNPQPQQNQNPCAKIKAQNNAAFKNKIDDLKSKLTLKKETGYIENDNGNFTYKDNATATENSNQLKLPDPDYYKDIKGYMHTHPNNFEDSEGRMRTGFKIFSPADVIYFNELVRNAKENGLTLDNVYAVMVSGTGTYQIRFTGIINQIKTTYTNTSDEYNEMYIKYFLANSKNSDELNFLKFMDEQMYVKGVSLIKMNDNGTFTNKTLNGDKTGIADSNCPQ